MTTLTLAWPDRPLWQNWRGHWGTRQRATRYARNDAWLAAIAAKAPKCAGARLKFEFVPPDSRKRDLANVIAATKPIIDGIADAIAEGEDSGFRCVWPEEFAAPEKPGAIIVTIEREK
jgi:hypothetical protein